MAGATKVFATISAIAVALAAWFYVQNRDLKAQLAARPAAEASASGSDAGAQARTGDPWTRPAERPLSATSGVGSGPAPTLPDAAKESRLERRQRRQQEFAAMFGRLDGETEEEYRARIVPLIKGGLFVPRQRVDEMRKAVETQAGVTAEQSKKLDQAFEKVYADALDYTNKAVADGQLSPYERNVSGWLEYAGGLGGILNEANGQIGQILSPEQLKIFSSSGFEWGEYLGLNAPWENLNPPPPR